MAEGDYRVDVDINVNKEQLDEAKKTLNDLTGKNKKISITIDTKSAINDLNNIENRLEKIAKTIKTINGSRINLGKSYSGNSGVSNSKKQADSTIARFNDLIALQGKMNKLGSAMGGLEGDKLVKAKVAMQGYMSTYNQLYATVAKKLNTDQIKQLNNAAGSSLPAVKQTINAWEELKRVTKDVGTLSTKLTKLDGNADSDKVRELTRQLNEAKSASENLRSSLSGQLSLKQYEQLNSELVKTENKIKEIEAGITDAKRNLSNKVSKNLSSGGDTTKSYNDIERSFRSITEASTEAAASIERVRDAKQKLDSVNSSKKDFSSKEEEVAYYDQLIAADKEYQDSIRSANNIIRENIAAEKEHAAQAKAIAAAEKEKAKASADAAKEEAAANKLAQKAELLKLDMLVYKKNNSKIDGTIYGEELNNLVKSLKNVDAVGFDNINGQFSVLKKNIELAGQTGLNFKDRLKMQFNRLSAYFGASTVIMGGIQATREMFENVKEVDKAMTELKRVTDLSSSQYSDMYDELTVSAREYGTTLSDIINATADWSRAGFDPSVAKGLAEVTTMYQHIADVDYDTAFQNLETAYKGFEDQLKQDFGSDTVAAVSYIGDILNELDNNFAVTADGVGQAIKRSASALSIAGNSIQETAGMVTGITEVTQDPEKAGNALKVLSMRLRGMKGQLEDLGEDTDETVENLSKMQGQVLNLTHGHVNIFDDTGQFKSTYEIMQGIAEIYDQLTSTEQADLLETIAGKHRANDVAALINNWDQVASATEHAENATGSAAREHEKYLDSIEGRMNALTSVWQTFSNTIISSDFTKTVISGLSGVLDAIEKIISTIGGFGTAGLIGAFLLGFKKRTNISRVISGFISNFNTGIDPEIEKINSFKSAWGEAWKSIGSFAKSPAGVLSIVGGVISVIGAITSAVEEYKESIRKANQETIDNSNKFLDSYDNFEDVYIKYANKTVLTSDEEEELKSAIDGTVSALGNKSNALREAAGASSEYVANLEKIAEAELKEAQRSATEAKKAAEENLKSEAGEHDWLSGSSKASFELPSSNTKTYEAIKDLYDDPNFRKYIKENHTAYDTGAIESSMFEFNKNSNLDEIIEYYNYVDKMRNRWLDEASKTGDDSVLDTSEYKEASETIDMMSSNMVELKQQTYEAAKAGYQLANGIASTDQEFYKMREGILSDVSDSIETRVEIGNLINEEYADVFDTSSIEAKMDYIKSVTKDISNIGGSDTNTFETFLDLKTKVNDDECTVGDYTSQLQKANDAINGIEDEQTKEFLRVQLGLELDSDGNIQDDIKKSRDKLINDLKSSGIAEDVATSFTDSLSNEELVVAQDLLVDGELDLKNLDSKKVREQIQKIAEHNKALQFSVNVDLETENLEKLNTAIGESLSGTGLSTESLTNVTNMFKGLKGYDASKLFERTANGVRLNTDELRKMNTEYAKTNVDGLNNKMSALAEEYNKTRSELSDLTYGTDEYNEKASELSSIEKQINDTEKLAAQYEGLTSAYNQWQQAESAGSQRDMYESIISGFKDVEDELSRGWVDDATIEFIELLSGKDLSSGNVEKIREAWEGLGKTIEGTTYTVKDFFTTNSDGESTSDGVYNFLEAVDQKFQNSDIIQKDANGNVIGFDFKVAGGDKAIAEALGISEELVQIMVRAADDAGFVVSMDGTYQNLDVLKDKAQEAANSLKEMFKGTDKEITTEFNLQTSDENSIMEQYKSALDIWNEFKQNKNADGTINMNVEGAQEAFTLVSTLQSMVDKLSEPTYMDVNVSEVEKNIQKPLSQLQQYERLTQEEHQLQLKGADTSEIEKSKSDILDYFQEIQKNQPEIAAKIGITSLSREELEQKLNDGSLEVDAALNLQVEMNDTLRDQVNIALYNAGLIDEEELKKRVNIDVYAENVDTSNVENQTEEAVEDTVDKAGEAFKDKVNNFGQELAKHGMALTTDQRNRITNFANDDSNSYVNDYADEQQTRVIKFVADWSEIDDYTDEQRKVVIDFVANNPDFFDELDGTQRKVVVDFVAKNSSFLNELDNEHREIALNFVAENSDIFNELGLDGDQMKIAVDFAVNNPGFFDEFEGDQKTVAINFVANNPGILDELDADQKKIAIEYVVENPDVLDGLDNEQKKVAIDFIVNNSSVLDGLEKEDQEVVIKYFVDNPGALDEFNNLSNEDKQVKIQAIVSGEEGINQMSNDLSQLDDKQVQVIAQALGSIDVEQLKTSIGQLDDKTVQAIATALGEGDVQGLQNAINGIPDQKVAQAIAEALGFESVEQLNGAIGGLDGKTVQAVAEALGIDSVEGLKGVINGLDGKTVQAIAEAIGAGNVTSLQSIIDNLKGKTVNVVANLVGNAVKFLTGGSDVDGTAHVNGTAFANGTTGKAFKQGDWGTKEDGVALGGELGTELLVRNGRWYTIGENGAEFFGYKKDDIIFNADQTRELFEKGKITHGNGRGKALASGTAFSPGSTGSGGWGRPNTGSYHGNSSSSNSSSSGSSSNSSSNSSSDAADEFEETLDLIEIMIDRVERAISRLDKVASSTYKTWSKRNNALNNQIDKTREEIEIQQRAYERYMQQASNVGLSSDWIDKIQNGRIDITTITDEDLNDKISEYKEWY